MRRKLCEVWPFVAVALALADGVWGFSCGGAPAGAVQLLGRRERRTLEIRRAPPTACFTSEAGINTCFEWASVSNRRATWTIHWRARISYRRITHAAERRLLSDGESSGGWKNLES